jgi:hypothetical protein
MSSTGTCGGATDAQVSWRSLSASFAGVLLEVSELRGARPRYAAAYPVERCGTSNATTRYALMITANSYGPIVATAIAIGVLLQPAPATHAAEPVKANPPSAPSAERKCEQATREAKERCEQAQRKRWGGTGGTSSSAAYSTSEKPPEQQGRQQRSTSDRDSNSSSNVFGSDSSNNSVGERTNPPATSRPSDKRTRQLPAPQPQEVKPDERERDPR